MRGSNTPKSVKDCWRTPRWLVEFCETTLPGRRLLLDAAAGGFPRPNAVCPVWLSEKEDGLSVSWSVPLDNKATDAVFCNPPYSNTGAWVKKAAMEIKTNGVSSVLVIPTPNGERYWGFIEEFATAVTFILGRVAFIHPETGRQVKGNTRGTCVVTFDAHRYERRGLDVVFKDRDLLIKMFE
jgi:phage N-6-adenine-methyltransferase